jgi:hypothetical protein
MPAAWFWLYPWLDALGRSEVVRRAASVLLQVAAWVVLVFGAIAVLAMLRLAFTSELPARAIVGALVLGVVIAGAVAAMHQVCLYHVRDVERLSDARFVMIPIVAVLARMAGELFAVWWAAAGIGGFLVLALAGPAAGMLSGAADVIPGMPSLPFTGWLGMIWFLVWCGAVGVTGLLVAYLWAEGLSVVVDIANRLHALTPVAPAAAAGTTAAAAAPAPAPVVTTPAPAPEPPPPPAPRPTPVPQERAAPEPPPAAASAPTLRPGPRPTPVPAPPTQVLTPASSPATRIVTPPPVPPPAAETVPVAAVPPQTYAERGEGGPPSTVILGPPRTCSACGATTTLVMAKFCEDCGARL